ncbi:MAG: metal-sulfur cluster assembly factor [Candidatus Aenigmarchaeota archaeon]|nr:metal-sulfur cluster assembly factor [Candidatus Aenigmarchaeota archaeon]
MVTKEDILKVLKQITDPEIGINIVDMGFIYDLKITEKAITVKMTLTTPGCPMHSMFTAEVEGILKKMFGKKVIVELVFDPPWTPEKMSAEARKKLGFG